MSARHGLEHKIWAVIREHSVADRKFLLACSGGADSVALVRIFSAILPKESLTVAYVHHGDGDSLEYRNESENFVRKVAEELGLSFVTRRHEGAKLKSEQDLRKVRRGFLEEIREKVGADLIVTAHHADDLLETRLIRLIRGTGPEGLPAIRPQKGIWFRPFLQIPARQLRDYLRDLSQSHVEDPTNADPHFLRNWLRTQWLPALETRRPGSMAALARSLGDIADSLTKVEGSPSAPVMERRDWERAPQGQKLGMIAACLRAAGQSHFTRGQLEEIRKRLDNRQKVHSFVVAGCRWAVNVQQIQVGLHR